MSRVRTRGRSRPRPRGSAGGASASPGRTRPRAPRARCREWRCRPRGARETRRPCGRRAGTSCRARRDRLRRVGRPGRRRVRRPTRDPRAPTGCFVPSRRLARHRCGAAHFGKTCSNAVDVTNVSSEGSNQITCEGCLPRRQDRRAVLQRDAHHEGLGMGGAKPIRDGVRAEPRRRGARRLARCRSGSPRGWPSSRRIVNFAPEVSSGTSLPTIPDSAGTLPVWSAACPGAVSVTAYG